MEDSMRADEERARTSVLCAVALHTPPSNHTAEIAGNIKGANGPTNQKSPEIAPPEIPTSPTSPKQVQTTSEGQTFVPVAIVSVEDAPKRDAGLAIWLIRHALHRNVVLMSGDNRRTALAVAKQLGINKVLLQRS